MKTDFLTNTMDKKAGERVNEGGRYATNAKIGAKIC